MKQYPNIDAIIEDSDTKVQDLAKVIGDFRNDISVHVFAKRRSPTWGSVFSLEHPLSFH